MSIFVWEFRRVWADDIVRRSFLVALILAALLAPLTGFSKVFTPGVATFSGLTVDKMEAFVGDCVIARSGATVRTVETCRRSFFAQATDTDSATAFVNSQDVAVSAMPILLIASIILGGIIAGRDLSSRSITHLIGAYPFRRRLWSVRSVWCIVFASFLTLLTLAAIFLGFALISALDGTFKLAGPQWWVTSGLVVGRSMLAAASLSLVGFFGATLASSAAGGLSAAVTLLVAQFATSQNYKYLPIPNADTLVRSGIDSSFLFGTGKAALYIVILGAVSYAASVVSFDAKEF